MNMHQVIMAITFTCILLPGCRQEILIGEGVSRDLARQRKEQISDVTCRLHFQIPASMHKQLTAELQLEFMQPDPSHELVLDFNAPQENILEVMAADRAVDFRYQDGHIVIPAEHLVKGSNSIRISFIAGELSLNRNPEYLYTLFVPDRASTAFPCFDQPDMKARFVLTLTIPPDWTATANAPLTGLKQADSIKQLSFAPTRPLPTYLFAFVAGKFDTISRSQNGRQVNLYHREQDQDKLNRNAPVVFDQVFKSIDWLEDYTSIDYPFAKYDLVAIPSFQYGGMEHPGAVLYRDSRIFLDESATLTQQLGRASLIAHETAHMWFGDMVTMKWFDEVWLKEVFANFMADKMVNPEFPEINHRLRFQLAHFPRAYSVDRTQGANPIIQELDNLKNAGTVYGDIIYHKAPIVMEHLERKTGEEAMQEGIQQYLSTYAYGNADWDELIAILEGVSGQKLDQWNRAWIYEAGMPVISSEFTTDAGNRLITLKMKQEDPFRRKRLWMQELDLRLKTEGGTLAHRALLQGPCYTHRYSERYAEPLCLLPNGSGMGYGFFKLDETTLEYLLDHIHELPDEVLRAAAWLDLYENFLDRRISAPDFIACLIRSIPPETEDLIISRMLQMLQAAWWQFLDPGQRSEMAGELEQVLWEEMMNRPRTLRHYYFEAFMHVVVTEQGKERLMDLWDGSISVPHLTLSQRDLVDLCCQLAIRNLSRDELYQKQLNRTTNRELKDMLSFVWPATAAGAPSCDEFFELMKDPRHREKEPWVITAMRYLNHPVREEANIRFLKPSLEMLEEIQLTGDIFFPKNWLDACLSGYSSAEAAEIVQLFIDEHPGYPHYLTNKILQSADMLFRSSADEHQTEQSKTIKP